MPASTLVAFALFQPVRRRVQTAVDHQFDRARYDGERTAASFAERRRDQVDSRRSKPTSPGPSVLRFGRDLSASGSDRGRGQKVKAAAKALVGVEFALGCAVAAFAASGLLISGRPAALSLLILLAAYVPYAGVGSVLVMRRPRNLIGWVLLGIGWTFAVSFLPIDATARSCRP